MDGLIHAHSGLRWVLLILLVIATINALYKWFSPRNFTATDAKLNLFTFIFAHTQLLLGGILYFMSDKVKFEGDVMGNAALRFFTVEHSSMMILAIILISVGHIKAKKKENDLAKFKTTAIAFLIALVLILAAIPWPFREGLNAGWF